MKFTIEQTLLAGALEKAMRGLSKSKKMPILQGIKLDATEQGIILTGSDLDSTLSILLFKSEGIEIIETGSTVVPRNVAEVIMKLKGQLELSVLDHYCTVKTKSAEFINPCWDPDEYPKMPNVNFEPILSISGERFSEMVNCVEVAVADDAAGMSIIEGINIKATSNVLTFNATDRQRFHRVETNFQSLEPFECNIPKKILVDLDKINKDKDDLEIYFDNAQFVAKCKNIIYFSRVLAGTYPPVERLLPDESEYELSLRYNRRELIEAFEQMMVFAKAKTERTTCFLYLDGLTSVLDTQSGNKGAPTKGKISVSYLEVKGESDVKIRFAIDYVLDSLKTMNVDEVILHLIANEKPFVVEPVEKDNQEGSFITMITPMRH